MGPVRRRPRRQAALNNRAIRNRQDEPNVVADQGGREEVVTRPANMVTDQGAQEEGFTRPKQAAFPSAKEIAAELLQQMLDKGVASVLPGVSLPISDNAFGRVPTAPLGAPPRETLPSAALGAPPCDEQATVGHGGNPRLPRRLQPHVMPAVPAISSAPNDSTGPSIQPPVQNVLNAMTGKTLLPTGSSHAGQPCSSPITAVAHLTPVVQHLLMTAIAPQTRKSYIRAFNLLQEFLKKHFDTRSCLPTTIDMLVYFIAHMYSNQMATATIKSYVTAVGYINKLAGFADPVQSFIIKKILAAVQRGSYQPDSRLPITPNILQSLVKALPKTYLPQYQQYMLKAMYLLAFHAFLRIGEITANKFSCHTLQYQDINIIEQQPGFPTRLEIMFKSFKGNYNIRPIVISIERNQDISICPVLSLTQYISLRGTSPGHLFTFPNNQPVSYQYFTECLKQTLAVAGIDAKGFTSHSFRIGAASTAAAQGISDEDIQHMGRWKSLAFNIFACQHFLIVHVMHKHIKH